MRVNVRSSTKRRILALRRRGNIGDFVEKERAASSALEVPFA
jgi:hypothetical protein